jgi:hypothetical protein
MVESRELKPLQIVEALVFSLLFHCLQKLIENRLHKGR